jgi:two-component system response regulator AtoC
LLTGHGNEKVRQVTESLNTIFFEKEEMGDFWHFVRKLNDDGQIVVVHPASKSTADGGESLPGSQVSRIRHTGFNRDAAAVKSGIVARPVTSRPEDRNRLRIVGETAVMQELRKSIARAASLDCAITLNGEPGTGKELAARIIHARSQHAHQRFLAIDCDNFNNTQLVTQLLGAKGGNLTGAIRTRSGIFGPDPVGTLLLDRVEAMPGHMQNQLLDTLMMAYRRDSGSRKDSGTDIRIIVAVETDLAEQAKTGAIKQELFESLNVFKLTLPPLRERKDDIHPLCRYFFDKYRQELSKSVDSIAPEVIALLVEYDFPGNVRELEHIIERAVIFADGKTVTRRHLPGRFLEERKPEHGVNPDQFATLAEIEKRYILQVLEATQSNKSKTAEILGISRAALWRKLKQFNAEKTAG